MASIAEVFQAGRDFHNSGNLQQAEQNYRQVLQADPRHADAMHSLGLLAYQVGKHQAAIQLISSAIRVNGSQAAYHADLAEVYRGLGQLDDAARSYRQALRIMPDYAEAHHNLGTVFRAQGKLAEAADCHREALRIKPDLIESQVALGFALRSAGQIADATACFETAVQARPDSALAHCALGFNLQEQGKLDAAVVQYRFAIQFAPQFTEAHYNLGTALGDQGRFEEAIHAFSEAVRHRPTFVEAHVNLAGAFNSVVKPDEAAAACRRALELDPQNAAAFSQLANALQFQADLDGAIAANRRAVELNPHDAREHSKLIYTLNFHPRYDPPALFAEHRAWAQRHAEPLTLAAAPHANDPAAERRLRVGYLSPHFHEHAVSFFSEPILAAHDHDPFEIYCYSDVRQPDAVTRRLQAAADHWRDVAGMPDEAIGALVRQDNIDILVDLAGHIGGNRLLVFAHKPAPIQVTYLGYQNTTGMSAMDYRLTDAHADPPGMTEEYYSERLLRLPGSFFCYLPPQNSPAVNELPALTAGHVTFASLNSTIKITPEALRTWGRVLATLPDSRLIVLAYSGGRLERDVRDVMAQEGVDPRRVEVVGKRPRREYLQLHHQIDIALDSFPFNGHTTTCDALWMGVPSIMLEGSTYASRFGGTALVNLGLEELIGRTHDEYVEIAVALAGDRPRLAQLRRELRPRLQASALVDAIGFTRNLEQVYRQIWRQWCERKRD
ncbi:MAG: tetratricopeptide repeat protein [Planctomycetia bacterium]|nr:tetratricopeptide repeat protein [Planctomycetia bacterium]